MKEYLKNLYRLTLILFTVVLIQSCGGSSEEPTANYSINASTSSISFSSEILQSSDDSFAIDVTFEGNGLLVGFAPETQIATWLEFRTENVTSNSATIHVDLVNAGNIIPNLYETKLRLSTGDVDNLALVHTDIDISLLIWQLTTSSDKVTFDTTFGETSVADKIISLTTNENEWQLSTDADWLTLDQTEGTGDAEINFSASITSFTEPGLYTANVTLTEATTGDSKTLPVEVALDNIYLYSDKEALLFSQLSDSQNLSTTIDIFENSPTDIEWQATTNQDWISLTPDTNTNKLTVSINTNLLGADELTTGMITVQANNADYVKPLTLKVTMFNKAITSEKIVVNDIAATSLVNSPSMPYTYLTQGNELRTYHQYTGELLHTLTLGSESAQLSQLLMSPTGEFVLARLVDNVTDETSGETSQVITRYTIDLTTNEATEISEPTTVFEPVALVSLSGRHFVVTQAMEFADVSLQRLYWDSENAFTSINVKAAAKMSTLFAYDTTIDSIKRLTTKLNDFTDDKITSEISHTYRPEGLEGSVSSFIVSSDESNLYVRNPNTEWFGFDGTSFTDNGKLPQTEGSLVLALAQRTNGNPAYARFSPADGFEVNLYDSNQLLEATVQTEGQEQPTSLNVSADNLRLVIEAAIDDQLIFIN